MPKLIAPKSDVEFKNAKPKDKEYLISDGGGLALLVRPDGSKHWIFRYQYERKTCKLYLQGKYPEMKAKDARDEAAMMRNQLANGERPTPTRKAIQELALQSEQAIKKSQETAFRNIAKEWLEIRMAERSKSTLRGILLRLNRNVLPKIGDRPIAEITAIEVLEVIRTVEKYKKHETAHRVLSECNQIFRYAVATGRLEKNVTTDLKGALKPVICQNRSAITDPNAVGRLLVDLDNYQGFWPLKFALRILPYVFTRPSELRLAEWAEFDFERAQWDIPAGRMKKRLTHLVPLSRQVIALLLELQSLGLSSKYLFPTPRQSDKPMSNVALLNGLRRMGYSKEEICAHGFRATARTLLDERLHVDPLVIEAQLAHAVSDPLGTAYNRTMRLEERQKMMQTWADYLDELRMKCAPVTSSIQSNQEPILDAVTLVA